MKAFRSTLPSARSKELLTLRASVRGSRPLFLATDPSRADAAMNCWMPFHSSIMPSPAPSGLPRGAVGAASESATGRHTRCELTSGKVSSQPPPPLWASLPAASQHLLPLLPACILVVTHIFLLFNP